jgi:hypothetical protein
MQVQDRGERDLCEGELLQLGLERTDALDHVLRTVAHRNREAVVALRRRSVTVALLKA